MKKHFYLACVIVLMLFVTSCSQQEVGTEDTQAAKLDREKVYDIFNIGTPFYISAVTRESSAGTEDLLLNPTYQSYQKNVFFIFFNDYVNFYGGSETVNDTIPETAKAFSLNTRISLPTNIRHAWDEAKGTMVLTFSGSSQYFPMLQDQQTAYLDPKTFEAGPSYDPESDTIPPILYFVTKAKDPKLGEVTYHISLKPMWFLYRNPNQQVFTQFVVY